VDLLRDAEGRGVRLRVMHDVMDTRGDERLKLKRLRIDLREAASSGGRKVFTVCHQKFAVIDSRSVVIGSANWANASIPKATVPGKFRKGNREWLVRITDDRVAKWFGDLFQADWDIEEMPRPSGTLLPPSAPVVESFDVRAAAVRIPDEVFDVEAPISAQARKSLQSSPPTTTSRSRAISSDGPRSHRHRTAVHRGWRPKTLALLQELAGRKRDVTIRIVVSPAFAENWEKTIETLEACGLADRLRAANLESFTTSTTRDLGGRPSHGGHVDQHERELDHSGPRGGCRDRERCRWRVLQESDGRRLELRPCSSRRGRAPCRHEGEAHSCGRADHRAPPG